MDTDDSMAPTPPQTVTMDVELVARLVGALERIGTAFTVDEINDARTLALVGRLAGRGDGGGTDQVDPARVRVARDYEIIRGLLGQAGSPRPLRMHRTRDTVEVDDPVPVAATRIVVDSPGDAASGPLSEEIPVDGNSTPILKLTQITDAMPISRVEVYDQADNLLAFGPSLKPVAPIY